MMLTRLLLAIVMLIVAGCDWHGPPLWSRTTDTSPPAMTGDATRGENIFKNGINGAPPCISCHTLAVAGFSLGPALTGISQRASERVVGLSAETYLRQSILEPERFIVPGYRPIMYPNFADHFSTQDVNDLIAFLETL